MSDNWLRYVPVDPHYQPSPSQAQAAERLLVSFLPMAEEIQSAFTEYPVFVDPGANWSGVNCPSCEADAEDWWGDAMSSAAEDDFKNLGSVAPCCGTHVSLNELSYGWPCAFGRYVLEAMNPNEMSLSQEKTKLLEAALGCAVREIPVHI
ncbi:MAG: hypothetical protein L6Q75_18920 [Burkholderiaceae bacterium]|nr:hypothetical protein [Burkholderiaceae bacterium]